MRYVDENKDRFVSDLSRLCRQPSISVQNKGMSECADLVKQMMEEVGLEVRILASDGGFPAILGQMKSKKTEKTLGFYNHYDVQPPEPYEQWISPPFEPQIREGKIYARGISDNKGNLVARLKAVETILKTIGEVPVNLKFFVDGEEETGSPHLSSIVGKNLGLVRADAYIWESGSLDEKDRPTVTLGYKGIMHVELQVREANTDVHSSRAPIIPNAAWRLIWALASMKGQDEKIRIRGWYDDVTRPEDDDIKLVQSIPFEEETIKKNLGIKKFASDLSGIEAANSLFFGTTCNVCGFSSGYTDKGYKSIVPSSAVAKVDFRLVPNQKVADLFGKVKAHLKSNGFEDVEVAKLGGYGPSRTSSNDPFAKLVIAILKEIYDVSPVVAPLNPATSPAYAFQEAMNIPVVSGGAVGYAQSRVHAPNENIRIRDYLRSIKFVATLINRFK